MDTPTFLLLKDDPVFDPVWKLLATLAYRLDSKLALELAKKAASHEITTRPTVSRLHIIEAWVNLISCIPPEELTFFEQPAIKLVTNLFTHFIPLLDPSPTALTVQVAPTVHTATTNPSNPRLEIIRPTNPRISPSRRSKKLVICRTAVLSYVSIAPQMDQYSLVRYLLQPRTGWVPSSALRSPKAPYRKKRTAPADLHLRGGH